VKSTVEPLEGNKVKLSVEVDAQEFEPAIDAAFRRIAKEVRADAIVVGKATGLRQGIVEEAPVSLVTLSVSEKVRGEVRPEIEIVVPRTLIQSGKLLLESGPQDQPLLGVGEEVLVFLSRYPERENSYSITSGDLGKYLVTTTAEGGKRADRYLMAAPVAGGVPLKTLIAQIRLELKIPDAAQAEKPASPKPQ